jgi:hypothetical protein
VPSDFDRQTLDLEWISGQAPKLQAAEWKRPIAGVPNSGS